MTKVAIVTGSNKGIGLSIVRSLCKQFDGDVFLTSRNNERGHAAVKLLEGEGLKPKYHQLDIENSESVDKLFDFMMKEYGGVDVLVNNAGIMLMDSDKRPFNDKVDATMNINFTSTFNITKKFLPSIKSNGRIVIVSSEMGTLGIALCSDEVRTEMGKLDMPQIDGYMKQYIKTAKEGTAKEHGLPEFGSMGPYLMSKTGATLTAMYFDKQAQSQGKGVVVNACCPGFVDTDLTIGAGDRFGPKKTPDAGAETPAYLALLPKDSDIHGRFIVNKVDKTDIFLAGKHSMAPKK